LPTARPDWIHSSGLCLVTACCVYQSVIGKTIIFNYNM